MIRRILTFIPPFAALALYLYKGFTEGFEEISKIWLIIIGLLFAAAVLLCIFRQVGLVFAIAVALVAVIYGFGQAFELVQYILGGVMAAIYALIAVFARKKKE